MPDIVRTYLNIHPEISVQVEQDPPKPPLSNDCMKKLAKARELQLREEQPSLFCTTGSPATIDLTLLDSPVQQEHPIYIDLTSEV